MITYRKTDKKLIAELYKHVRFSEATNKCRSDLSLPYLLTYWQLEKVPEYAWVNKNLVLLLHDIEYSSKQTVLVGDNLILDTLKQIFNHQALSGEEPQINMATSETVQSLRAHSKVFIIEHDRDLDEYILDSSVIADFLSPKLRTFRQAVSSFNRNYGSMVAVQFNDMSDRTVVHELVNSLHSWETHRNTNNDPGAIEKKYNDAMLSAPSESGILSMIVRLNGKPIGFCLYSMVAEKSYCLPHIIQVDYSYNHIFDYVLHSLCSRMSIEGIKFINAEEDMGIPGIRHKKKHLAPIDMDMRYTIRPSE
jgi:hypothetical protein